MPRSLLCACYYKPKVGTYTKIGMEQTILWWSEIYNITYSMSCFQLPWFHIQFERLGFGHLDALLYLFSNLLQHTWTQFISWAMLCIYECFIYTSRFLYPSYSHDGYEFKLIKMPNLVYDKFIHIFHGFWSIKGLLLSMPYKCEYNTLWAQNGAHMCS